MLRDHAMFVTLDIMSVNFECYMLQEMPENVCQSTGRMRQVERTCERTSGDAQKYK
jgi:hypothetical protein